MTAAPIYVQDAYLTLMPFVFWAGVTALVSATILNIRDYYIHNGFKLPDLDFGYINIYDAACALREEKIRQGNTAAEALDQMKEFEGKLSAMQHYAEYIMGNNPLKVRRKNSKQWTDLEDRKLPPHYTVTLDGKSLMHDGVVVFPEVKIKRSYFRVQTHRLYPEA